MHILSLHNLKYAGNVVVKLKKGSESYLVNVSIMLKQVNGEHIDRKMERTMDECA